MTYDHWKTTDPRDAEWQEPPMTDREQAIQAFDDYLQQPIQTEHVYPPIPDRRFDWCAYRDPEHYLKGWGRTEQEAIADLLTEEDANAPEDIDF